MIENDLIARAKERYGNEPWLSVVEEISDNELVIEKGRYVCLASTLQGTVRIQNETTSKAGIKKYGFDELMQRLSNMPGNVEVLDFDSPKLAGRCVFTEGCKELFGCTIVEKRARQLKTPPNWDGSKEMLDEFNKNNPA